MKKFSKEIKIALVAIIGIVVLYYGMQFLKGLTYSTDNRYFAKFEDISGLSVSSPIFANGYRVGVVEDIIFDYENHGDVVAVLDIDHKLVMPKGTSAEIASDMLGNIKLELNFGPRIDEIMEQGDTINGEVQDGLMAKAADMIPHLEKLLPKVDSILGSVNALLSNPALANSLNNIEGMTGELSKTSRDLNVMMGSLKMQLPQLMTRADGVLANVDTLTRTINQLDLITTVNKANATLANVEQLTAKLNSPEGTVGMMMNDPSIYNNLNSTVMHLDSLMIDLKAHPGRYLHFSVFGKKQK